MRLNLFCDCDYFRIFNAIALSAPSMPMGLSYVAAGTDFITVQWTEVSTATAYRVEYNLLSDASTLNVTSDVRMATLTGLMSGMVYEISVVAVNENANLESMSSSTLNQITSMGVTVFTIHC